MRRAALVTIVAAALRMNLRRLTTWVFAAVFVLIATLLYVGGLSVGGMVVTGQKLATNAEYTVAMILAAFSFILMHFTATLTGDPIVRDVRLGAAQLVRATPLDPRTYALGKFLGGWLSLLALYAIFLAALLLGQLLPAGEKLTLPFRLWPYLKFGVLFVVVPTFFVGALAFAVGTLTGSMKLVYAVITALLVGWLAVSQLLDDANLRYTAWLEPSGLAWLTEKVAKSRGNAWLNENPIRPDLGFYLNRFGLFSIGALALLIAVRRYRDQESASDAGGEKRAGTLQRCFDWFRGRQRRVEDRSASWSATGERETATPRSEPALPGFSLWLAHLAASITAELRILAAERSLWIMVPLVMFLCGVNQTTWAGPFNVPIYPVSSEYAQQMVPALLILLAGMSIFYTGEVFHRDDSSGVRPIVYATPVHDSALLLGKLAATLVLSLGIVLATLTTAVISQLVEWRLLDGRGYLDLAPYVDVGWQVILPAALFLCTTALVINVLIRGRYLAYFACILLGAGYVWLLVDGKRSLLFNPLALGHWSYSDMTRLEPFQERLALRNAFWGSSLAALFALAIYFLQRTEGAGGIARWGGWRQYFTAASLRRRAGVLSFAALMLCAAGIAGARIRSRENLRGTREEFELSQLALEDTYFSELHAPRLAYEKVDLEVRLRPEERALDVRGSLVLCNPYEQPIGIARFTVDPLYAIRRFELERAREPWTLDGPVLTVRLEPPLAQGERVALELDWSGVVNPELGRNGGGQSTFIHRSAVFLSSFNPEVLPVPGISSDLFLADDERRAKHGRGELHLLGESSRESFVPSVFGADRPFEFTAQIDVPLGLTALTGGALEGREVRGDREVFRYHSAEAVASFAILAADYSQESRGPDQVLHHPAHTFNLPTVLEALADARASFARDFGPTPHELLRIAEFPRLASFAQSYPTLMPYSEAIGFLTNFRGESRLVDATYFVTAHEVAHQWWGYVAHPGRSRGAQVLSESLAEYSAMLLIEEHRGERARLGFLEQEEDSYLRRRDPDQEVALAQLEFEGAPSWYNKGCFVFAMLEREIGRERLLAGLASYARRWRDVPPGPGRAASHPTLDDLLAEIRAQHPGQDLDWFYEQWFERLLIPDMAVESALLRREGKTWTVDFEATNRQEGRMPVQVEAVAGAWDLDLADADAALGFQVSAPMRLWLEPGKTTRGTLACDFEPESLVIDRTFGCLDFDRTNNQRELEPVVSVEARHRGAGSTAAPSRGQR